MGVTSVEQAEAEVSPPSPLHERDKGQTIQRAKWKLGEGLKERDQLDVLRVLEENNDRFAYNLDYLEQYTGPPMEIRLNNSKDIFRPPHKLGEKEWEFVGEHCAKLEKLGFIRKSD